MNWKVPGADRSTVGFRIRGMRCFEANVLGSERAPLIPELSTSLIGRNLYFQSPTTMCPTTTKFVDEPSMELHLLEPQSVRLKIDVPDSLTANLTAAPGATQSVVVAVRLMFPDKVPDLRQVSYRRCFLMLH